MKLARIAIIVTLALSLSSTLALAGNKKIMAVRAAKIAAERGIVESIYGLKIRSSESVVNLVAAGFEGKTEVKTEAEIRGIKISEIVYDEEKDIAQATATIKLDKLTNIDGQELDFKGKTFTRVGFATGSDNGMNAPLKALRAAEIDAYTQLAKRIVGFTLESQTTVENYILTSDIIKSKVLATIYLARVTDYGWDKLGDAYVKMSVNTSEVSDIIGQKIVDEDEVIEVEGQGAQSDDYSKAKGKK